MDDRLHMPVPMPPNECQHFLQGSLMIGAAGKHFRLGFASCQRRFEDGPGIDAANLTTCKADKIGQPKYLELEAG